MPKAVFITGRHQQKILELLPHPVGCREANDDFLEALIAKKIRVWYEGL